MNASSENSQNIGKALFVRIKKHPEKIALDYYGKEITYSELGEEVSRYRAMVYHLTNGKAGERIALFMPNIPQFVFAYYGAIAAGAYVVPVNFASIVKDLRTKPIKKVEISDDIKFQFTDCNPTAIIVADVLLPVLMQMDKNFLRMRTVLVAEVGEYLPGIKKLLYPIKAKLEGKWVRIPTEREVERLNKVLKKFNADEMESTISHDGVAQILYTTGTTGVPKGVMLTHKNLLSNMEQCLKHLSGLLNEGEVVLSVLPMFHSYGMMATLYMCVLGLGGKVVLLPTFTPKDTVNSIKRCEITIFPAVNKIFQRLCDVPKLRENDFKTLKFCISGAGRLDPELKSLFERISGTTILEGYGLSETSPIVSVMRKGEKKPLSVGRAVPSTEMRIINIDDGVILGKNQEGEIFVKGPQVMAGYYNKPQETGSVLRDGWLATGDIGYLDEGGFLYITDRKKEMSSVSGENVSWNQVETFLVKRPSIVKCAAIGVPDKKSGDAIVAFVVLESNVSVNEAEKYAESSPNKLLVPREIISVSEEIFGDYTKVG
jgi:long-chain acyl-CoA synthetase